MFPKITEIFQKFTKAKNSQKNFNFLSLSLALSVSDTHRYSSCCAYIWLEAVEAKFLCVYVSKETFDDKKNLCLKRSIQIKQINTIKNTIVNIFFFSHATSSLFCIKYPILTVVNRKGKLTIEEEKVYANVC